MAGSRFNLSIVIPVWNGWNLTEACLRSLAAHTPGDRFQVVLADNGSTDQTPTAAPALGQALFPGRFVHHRLPENLGFAKGCNAGAHASSAAHLLFLNNDTTVTENWLPPLLDALRADPRLAGVTPLLLFPDDRTVRADRVQHLGIACAGDMDFRHLYEYFPRTHPAVARRRRLNVVTAAALLLPAPLFHAHGGFFEGFVNGMEDVDLCLRIARRGGHFSVIPESVVRHHTHGTQGRFDHESANLSLLRTRCRDAAEDLPDLVLADGFEPGFTPWLDLMVRLPRPRTAELDARHRDADEPALRDLIEAEPLWDTGYHALVRLLENQNRTQEAASVAYLRSLLCPGLDAFRDCERILRRTNTLPLADHYARLLEHARRRMADPAALARKARALSRDAHPAVRRALTAFLDGTAE
ncbi:glycosyl transferase family 2 [Pseudodesulfovibrio mercurii]|uniref:Glycosyl transferase family 2 n=1 Tax=Pseudodesulfovibrio mercurii TaxID=641491 RepID=F0JC46_9BACT|nr:glycosyltransferase [Pseudodesulfovibrio mercurii]EGB15619.1 glycosyl transferase family 2 [Pseudodesulfovibrio mercurii]